MKKTRQKLNKRGYGNRPFRNYAGHVSITDIQNGDIIYEKISLFRRFINWFKKFV